MDTVIPGAEGVGPGERPKIVPLGSGSKGNCIYVGTADEGVLIDGGFSGRETQRRLRVAGIHLSAVKAILLTHEHGDHIRGVRPISRQLKIPAYMTRHTYLAIGAPALPDLELFSAGEALQIGRFQIDTVPLPHDAVDPVAFAVQWGSWRVGCVTDLGYGCQEVVDGFGACDFLVLEANHDAEMLAHGPYPYFLKKRIRGDRGHLSNAQGAALFADLAHGGLKGVVLAHLSEKNNQPHLALNAFKAQAAQLGLNNLPFWVARQDQPVVDIEF